MAYTDPTKVRLVLAPDGVDDGSLGTAAALSDDELNEAIAEAQSQIDGRLAGRYSVPFPDNDVPAVIEQIARDTAAYLATLVVRRNNPIPADDPVRQRYTRAQAMLDQVAKGQLDLLDVEGVVGQQAEATVVNPYDGELFPLREFGLGKAEGEVFSNWSWRRGW